MGRSTPCPEWLFPVEGSLVPVDWSDGVDPYPVDSQGHVEGAL